MPIADLHIHSRFSRATSKDCDAPHLDLWARRKGIHLLGTGDFTHPAWREEMLHQLERTEDGLYRLKDEFRLPDEATHDQFQMRITVAPLRRDDPFQSTLSDEPAEIPHGFDM